MDATKFSELLGEDEKTVKPLFFFRAADNSRDGLLQFDEFADGVSSLPGFTLFYVDHKRLTRDQVMEVVDGGWNWLTRVHWRNTRCQSQCATSWEDCLMIFVDEGNTFKMVAIRAPGKTNGRCQTTRTRTPQSERHVHLQDEEQREVECTKSLKIPEAWEVLGIHKLFGALKRKFFDVDTVQAYWLVQGSPRYERAPAGTGGQIEVLLVPRDNHDRNRASQDTCP